MSVIKRVLALIAALLLLPAALATGVRYSTVPLERDTLKRTTTANGMVLYLETQSVAAWESGARLGSIPLAVGDAVNAGDVVATYAVPVSATAEKQAEINLRAARDDYQYELTARTAEIVEMKSALAGETDATGARILELKIERAELVLGAYQMEAEAEIAALEAAYENAKAAGDERPLAAGISGVVYSVAQLEPGAAVEPSRALVSIANPEKVLVRADNAEGLIKYGMEVEVRLSGASGQASVKGTVVAADNVLPGELRGGFAYIAFEMPERGNYQSATVAATTMLVEDALIAPSRTVSYKDGASFVSVLDADGTVRTRHVVKAMDTGTVCWILLGANEGDKLITK